MRWAGTSAALLVAAAALLASASAGADFGSIQLVSKSAGEQAAVAQAPAISADGRYLAFEGTIGGLRGVFRKDLGTGAVEPVAAGSAYESKGPKTDSGAPSISADGRYVSFTTKTALVPDDPQTASSDVYVADMDADPPTYELASAPDGSIQGLTYSGAGGSVASGRVALSADGREVVFVTNASSNLTSVPGGSTEGTQTPAGQVVLRDLDSRQTTLVSAERDAETGAMTELPVKGGAVIAKVQLPLLVGASLSADGTTVAWLGADVDEQAPLLPGESAIAGENGASPFPYVEPLWRRVADGPQAPTRRVVGGDPSAPFPDLTARNTELNSAQGWLGVQKVDGVPELSADGRTVALIGNPTDATNVFVVDMSAGLSRGEAVRRLTAEIPVRPTEPERAINQEPYVSLNGHVYSLAISPDGSRIALATARQRFPLAPPNLVGSPLGSLGLVELYVIDLPDATLQRVTHGVGGEGEASLAPFGTGQGGEGAGAPSFAEDGRLIAFSSTASNLVEGDANEASDAFTARDVTTPGVGGSSISPAPAPRVRKPSWRLVLSASSLPDGDVRVVASVPAPGTLRAKARAELGPPPSRPRPLAAARGRARSGGRVALTLALPHRYLRLAHSREGLFATAHVSFRAKGGKTLRGKLEVRFRAHRRGAGKGRSG